MRDRRDRMHGWPLKPGRGPERFNAVPVDRGEMRDSLRRGGATYHYVGRFGMPGMEEMHGIASTAREGGGAYHGLAPTSELKSKRFLVTTLVRLTAEAAAAQPAV